MQTSPSPSWTASGRLITRVILYRLRTYGYCATRGMFSRCWTSGLSISNPGRVSSGSRSGTLSAKSGLFARINRVRGGQKGRFRLAPPFHKFKSSESVCLHCFFLDYCKRAKRNRPLWPPAAPCRMSYSRVNTIFLGYSSISEPALPAIFTASAGVPVHTNERLAEFQVQSTGQSGFSEGPQ